ncbi:MAG: hypothetical protein CFE24_10190 [Flavobacterium sp. BFFFF2]|nr:MAG: hypothetical protein CFE24_10190 [Flavobacterium sp. BFFFF2]
MPFTFSHPALVIPLGYLPKKWISMTGLVIGSIAPDFEYFLRMRIQSNYSHTIAGLFLFDLPLGIFLAYMFHLVVRNTLCSNLPTFLQYRFAAFNQFDWHFHVKKHYLIIFISMLVGAASHLFWDSFTHKDGYFVLAIPFLTDTVHCFNYSFPFYKIVQHSSTFIGGLVIAGAIGTLPKMPDTLKSISATYWLSIAGFTLIIIFTRIAFSPVTLQIGHLLATAIAALLISTTVVSFAKGKIIPN